MLGSQIDSIRKTLFLEIFGGKGSDYFWESRFLPRWLPLLLGLILGIATAALINEQAWQYLIPLVLLVPAAILFNRYPFIAIILWLLFTQFFIEPGSPSGRFIFWILHRAIIPLALVIVLVSSGLRASRKKMTQLGHADLAVFTFLLITFINLLILNPDVNQGLIKLYDLIFVPLCMYWLVRLIAPNEVDLKRLVPVILVLVLSQSIIGLMQWFIPASLPPQWIGTEGARTTGTTGNPAVYTTILLFGSLIMFQYAMQTQSRWIRNLLMPIIGLALACVFFSFSRGSWLGGLFVIVGLLFVYPVVVFRSTIIFFIIMVILSSSILAAQMSHAIERLNTERTANDRIVQNYATFQMIATKPFFGWGWGNYDRYDRQFHNRVSDNIANISKDQSSHNTYLSMIAELGMLTFAIYYLPLLWWFWYSLKIWHRLPREGFWARQLLAMFWLLMIHIAVVSSFIDMVRFNLYGTTIYWLVLGLIGTMVQKYLKADEVGMPKWAVASQAKPRLNATTLPKT